MGNMRDRAEELIRNSKPGPVSLTQGELRELLAPWLVDDGMRDPQRNPDAYGIGAVKEDDRIGDWNETHTGVRFHPLDPRPEEVSIYDVARSLSRVNRYNGHIELENYTVAEHSVLMARDCRDRGGTLARQAAMLMHDSPETYLPDLPRPLKRSVWLEIGGEHVRWSDHEDRLMGTIIQRFALLQRAGEEDWSEVKRSDAQILVTERTLVVHARHEWRLPPHGLDVRIEGWRPLRAEREFLGEFFRIFGHGAV